MNAFPWILGASIALVVVGFVVPPFGFIDGSVLTAVGELLAFAALAQLSKAAKSIVFTKGDMKVEVNSGS